MRSQYLLTSVCRIADLEPGNFDVAPLPRDQWDGADYIAVEIRGEPSSLYRLELANGRLIDVLEGNRAIGALGKRSATLEATGDWEAIGADGMMEALTGAGLFGKATSVAPTLPRLMTLEYAGHVLRDGRKLSMRDFVPPSTPSAFSMPTILLVGTSMSAGKTTTGRIIIQALERAGLNVAGTKFTGAGRYRDILSFQDAGADIILDFVDAGLPSTVVPLHEFDMAMTHMLSVLERSGADVLVAEAGASPLEPYNGDAAVAALGENIVCTVLCASDPYAVVGVQKAFGLQPDLVTGPTANTDAGIELVRKLTGLTALNLLRADSRPALLRILENCLSTKLAD
jgi:hypothetical protein